MRAGCYELQIRALVNGQFSEITSLQVTIEAPWYATTFAKIVYLLLFVFAMLALIRYKQERMKTQYEEQKMKFLINATHDIRSPLTLIMGPLKKLKQNANTADNQRYIDIIERNAQRMLTLVNQILDVRKIDLKQMQIHCSKTDVVALVNGIVSLYRFHVKERNITLSITHNKGVIELYVDRGSIEKVINNLLSNAVKYTFDGGEISIDIEEREHDVVLSVEDNGVGMSQKEYVQVFNRYYQGVNSRGYNVGGTGIGLNLCKQLVELHHGTISAGPRKDGKQGSRFTVTLLLGKEHLLPEEIDESISSAPSLQKVSSRKDGRILVADDDMEVARYIKLELGTWYNVNIVSNGVYALQALLIDQYDLLISDVMMPEMDGITLLKNVKQNPNISDVPVILLTSQAEVEDRLRGLENGADAFIPKPFSINELHITIDNLINNVRRLRGKFSGMQTQDDKIDNVEMEDNDKRLMEKIVTAVNNNYKDSDYGVEQLSSDVGLSRVQLHRKMKQLTGIAASDFIRNIRLKQAARLLSEKNVNVGQVAYAVGFKSLAHFSTLFKKYYGVTPTEYGTK
jgi:signal transduction histidine kinase/DNA-binding response OmpR family regulator